MPAERVRKCPECGRTYPVKVLFCRTDGCQLGDPGDSLSEEPKLTPGRDQLLGRTVARRFVLTEYIGSGATGLGRRGAIPGPGRGGRDARARATTPGFESDEGSRDEGLVPRLPSSRRTPGSPQQEMRPAGAAQASAVTRSR